MGKNSHVWVKDETNGNPFVYYEQVEGEYTDVTYTSVTFTSNSIKYTKDSQYSCLVANALKTTNKINIMDYDCSKKAYALCRMFKDPEKTLSLTPPPPPIFYEKTELPNFNCYLESSETTNNQDIPSNRRKRDFENNDKPKNDTVKENANEKLSLLLDPSKETQRNENLKNAKKKFQSDFGDMDMSISYPYFFELLWYSQLPCTDVKSITSGYKDEKSFIKRCYWEEKEVECHLIFQMKPTDRGMCCSFNVERLEKTLRSGIFSEVVEKLQTQNLNLSFSENSEVNIGRKEDIYYGKPGQGKGLMVFLDNNNDKVSSGTVFDEFTGFATVVDGSEQFPLTFQKSFLIQPGYENSVAISAVDVKADEDIRSIPPNKRMCYFPDEHPLNLYRKYSHSNCMLECSLEYTIGETKKENGTTKECLPWFYPIKEIKNGFCDPWQTKIFLKIMKEIPSGACSHCLPDCDNTMYDASVSTAPIRFCDHTNLGASNLCTMNINSSNMNPSLLSGVIQNEFWKTYNGKMPDFAEPKIDNLPSKRLYVSSEWKKHNLVFKSIVEKNPDYDAFENDIALVNFYFEEPYVQQYKMQHVMKFQDFIAQVGGLFSLAVGMSLVSIFEIVWHLALLPIFKVFLNDK